MVIQTRKKSASQEIRKLKACPVKFGKSKGRRRKKKTNI